MKRNTNAAIILASVNHSNKDKLADFEAIVSHMCVTLYRTWPRFNSSLGQEPLDSRFFHQGMGAVD